MKKEIQTPPDSASELAPETEAKPSTIYVENHPLSLNELLANWKTASGDSIWNRKLTYTNDHPLSLNELLANWRGAPEHSIAFTIAVIALGAKMAKADGRVSPNEIKVFRQVFDINDLDENKVAKVYNLARQDVAGFESYASKIARMFAGRPEMLEELVDCLFQIALADGVYHPAQDDFIRKVADIFAMDVAEFARMRRRYAGDAYTGLTGYADACLALGVDADASVGEARAAWMRIVKDNHPDKLIARGLSEEQVGLANNRLLMANRAWEAVEKYAKSDDKSSDE